jgi:hypothetical protein
MKRLLILTFLTITFFSCKKEEINPEPITTIVYNTDSTEIVGNEWDLVNAKIYVENLDNGEKTYFDHFSNTQVTSNLNPFNNSTLDFDEINLGTTTWEFTNSGFALDGVLVYSYSKQGTANPNDEIYRIDVGGSSRYLEVLEKKDGVVTFKVYESYGTYQGANVSFYTTLTFIEKGEFCNNCEPDADYGYTYGGVIDNVTSVPYSLDGTTWVITRVLSGLANEYPNDTLVFGTNTYTWVPGGAGNSITENYSLNKIVGNNSADLTLYSNPSIGGDYSGSVPENFIDVGVVDGITFTDVFGVNSDKTVWIEQI